jgi:hypothetical protein
MVGTIGLKWIGLKWIYGKYPKLAIILSSFLISSLIFLLVFGIFHFDLITGISITTLFFVVFVILLYKLHVENKEKVNQNI